ncbi:cytochrome B [Pacificimonas flava]|uniref:Cytochrome B n=2 Tax=Pacificimonas TaxID=1960290 RepID=A0A219B569_9SPHN|nr:MULTISPECIES: YqaA family protein [Pacificimonas]MBZ6379258.1 DedA family protein [Pacificimonas aurantium]OWV33530.1 cytochrome B [Pacificimonas flava]
MLKSLYRWTLEKAANPLAERWLALVSFLESSVFPIPPDVMLVPMALARPHRALRLAGICTFASVCGAALGWIIGASFFEVIGAPIVSFYGAEDKFAEIQAAFNEEGVAIVLLAGFTPIPFKVITIASGMTGMSIYSMLAASIVGRGARFFLLAGLLKLFGEPVKRLIDRHFGLITILVALLIVAGFAAIHYLL